MLVPSEKGKLIKYDDPNIYKEKCPPFNGSLGQHREYYEYFLNKTRPKTNFTSTICDIISEYCVGFLLNYKYVIFDRKKWNYLTDRCIELHPKDRAKVSKSILNFRLLQPLRHVLGNPKIHSLV